MKVKSESEVAQSCPTLSDTMDCSPPGSSIHGIFQARVLEWGATHLEPDNLECAVKWALESIITNKASGSDGIPAELFQILKDYAVKVEISIWKFKLHI